ncbi:endoribonuclease L-PSP [Alicyclobacillus cellulosilyticus]|uniref:Endoribonuclease L-PSP n=1 Tax=Alicyclobacillus cellulosilyticus TaxID=1003997 RepID=A0A917KED4_9BACL|nr:RidA family protein [Alicyclobacillus cellulosilyticus]GGJ08774.1 endoribonuclease L-PSP [Alicyclobacillus cellulosilyticus]
MDIIATAKAPAAIGPYAQAVAAGPFVFTSGQIPLRPDGTMVEGDIRAQAEQVLHNLDAVLAAAGCRREDVVKATIFLTDLAAFATVNEVYAAYFGDHRPARSTVQVAALPRGAQVEIEFVAVRPVR